jgi:hypothetical protein
MSRSRFVVRVASWAGSQPPSTQPLERLVADLEPVQAPGAGAHRVRQHEAGAPVGFGRPGRAAMRAAAPARHVGDRHAAPTRDAHGQGADRPGSSITRAHRPSLPATSSRPLDRRLVVAHAALEQRLAPLRRHPRNAALRPHRRRTTRSRQDRPPKPEMPNRRLRTPDKPIDTPASHCRRPLSRLKRRLSVRPTQAPVLRGGRGCTR